MNNYEDILDKECAKTISKEIDEHLFFINSFFCRYFPEEDFLIEQVNKPARLAKIKLLFNKILDNLDLNLHLPEDIFTKEALENIDDDTNTPVLKDVIERKKVNLIEQIVKEIKTNNERPKHVRRNK
jgi:hypothetical protein